MRKIIAVIERVYLSVLPRPADERLLWATLLYYASLWFVNSNITLAVATAIYIFVLALIRNSLTQSLWLALVATALIAHGKTYTLTLIPKEQLTRGFFDVNYILPVYINDAVFVLLLLQLVRRGQWLAQKMRAQLIPAVLCLLFFQAVLLVQSIASSYSWIILLSAIQFLKLILIFILPTLLEPIFPKNSNIFRSTALVIGTTFIVQIIWVLLQTANQGSLGKFIEAMLFEHNYGVITYEDKAMLRTTGWFFDPALLGTFLVCQVSMYLWRLQKSAYKNALSISAKEVLLSLLGYLAITTTLNRLLIIITTTLIFLGLFFIRKSIFFNRIKTPLFVGIALIVIATSPIIIKRFSSLSTSFDEYGSGRYRYEQFIYSMRMISTHPNGVGINLSPYFLETGFGNEDRSIDSSHPHNIVLQLLVETGLFGFASFLLFIFVVYRPYIVKKISLNQFGIAGIAYLLCAQFYPIFINQSELLIYFFFYLGLAQAKTITNKMT